MRRASIEHAHLAATSLASERLVERPHRRLRRAVRGHAGQVGLGDHAGDVDDRATGLQLGERGTGQHDGQERVGEEQFLHRVDGQFVDGAEGHDARSVDHHVEATVLVDGRLHRGRARFVGAEVERSSGTGKVELVQ